MNTIPSIFNERQINRSTIWGKELNHYSRLNASVILLNEKGSQFRQPLIENLVKCGFNQIVSIELSPDNYNLEELAHKFPFVKFIIPLEKATEGELINIGMSEISTDYVLVVRDTLRLNGEFINQRILDKLTENNPFCVVPRLVSVNEGSFPVVFSPGVNGATFKISTSSAVNDGLETLSPYDFIAIYNRKKFIQLGGYDYTISSPYWQNMDLGFRAWLWGEKIRMTTIITLAYSLEIEAPDVSNDLSYSRFFMKNLLARFDEDHGVIPKSSFFVYCLRSGCGLIESIKLFADACSWVEKNKYRFKMDAKYLVENWGKIK